MPTVLASLFVLIVLVILEYCDRIVECQSQEW